MRPLDDPKYFMPNDESQTLRSLRLTRWERIGRHLPKAGIITVFCPAGYDKTRFAYLLLDEHWVENHTFAYVSVSTLERTPMALLRAIAGALPLPATHRLPAFLARSGGRDDVGPELIGAASEHLQDPALARHMLILDDLDEMTDEMTGLLATTLLRTMGRVAPRVVLCGRSDTLRLRQAGVPVTTITEEQLALSPEELRAMGVTDPALLGWPLAAWHTFREKNADPSTLIDTLLGQVESRVLESLEAASLSPDWPLGLPMMRALEVHPDFVTRALAVGLPILRQPNERYHPHPLLQRALQRRLKTDPARLERLSAAYAGVDEMDSGRQLEALLNIPQQQAQRRLAGLTQEHAEDLEDWVSAHAGVLWKLYEKNLLTQEPELAVHLARARGQRTSMKDGYAVLNDPAVRPAGMVMIEEARAHLAQFQGRYTFALAAQKRAVAEMEKLEPGPENAAVYGRTALLETTVASTGDDRANLMEAQRNAHLAIRAAPAEGSVRSMAYSVLSRVHALRGNGVQEDPSVLELSMTSRLTPDVLRTARLVADGLMNGEDPLGATPLLKLIERGSPQSSAAFQVELPLLYAKQALMSGVSVLAAEFADRAWRALTLNFRDYHDDQALMLYAAESRLLVELYARHTMTSQERKKRPLKTLRTTVLSQYRYMNELQPGPRGATLAAIEAWMDIQDEKTQRSYGILGKLLPELLEARSRMYIPALLLLLEKEKLPLVTAVRCLQEARNRFGPRLLKVTLSTISPNTVVPEAPRLDVQLFGVPRVTLDGRELQLSPRATLLLGIMVTNGAVSIQTLEGLHGEDFPTENHRWKAISDLKAALGEDAQGEDYIALAGQKRKVFGLQRFSVHSDYANVPHLTPMKRQALLSSPFMDGIDAVFVRRMRKTLHW